MRISDIRETSVPVASTMRNAAFDFSEMTTSVVAVVTDVMRGGKPVIGYAFNSTGRYACGAAMRARFVPRILSAAPDSLLDEAGIIDPVKVMQRMMMREKPGGDAERSVPIGTIETAVWDAVAKILDRPLWHVLAERFGSTPLRKVPCYVGGGWYKPENDLKSLTEEVERHLGNGYTRLKIKVGGVSIKDDLARIESAIALIGAGDRLAVDANAALSVERMLCYGRVLAPLGLRWFEEPCGPLDYATFARLAESYDAPLATGENLFCQQDVENLFQFGGFRRDRDILQVDPPQAYGVTAYAQMVARVEALGGSRQRIFPHGGNMMSFALVAGLGLGGCEAYPGVFAAFGGFADGMDVDDGEIAVPDYPGIGFEAQPGLYQIMRTITEA
ncbi:mandelate racemase [Tardiphaga sp. vice352]|uniref:enolase C-terminal domain-like protein n=1 Tax=unclassified Tardiphaga TaxID=2631404 RepID=UPI001165299F|nr:MULTISPECIES: enolase C-terminal domain-like protein [unclassified Tardiphaga]QDM14759.1 mandelate racemase [Tardiphaga sp. vice278]QDM24939.1 mandelate racemase [Tardiphaga sp. vice304]QDM30149.1 mandelate racemase [Tardiphaga sp. vice352]